eukprot:11583746-Alexandrium_andersonii.AAC.1
MGGVQRLCSGRRKTPRDPGARQVHVEIPRTAKGPRTAVASSREEAASPGSHGAPLRWAIAGRTLPLQSPP